MPTAQAIINRACDLFGYKDPSESLSSSDSTNFLGVLNDMLDGWNTQRLYMVNIGEVVQTVSGLPITIGPTGTINVPRPSQMEDGAFIRMNGSDYPVRWISQIEYDEIIIKSQAGVLAYCGYYDPEVPLGKIYLWPQPVAPVELHLQIQQQLTSFADLTTNYTFAVGYSKALAYSLAEELAPGKRELSPSVIRLAYAARRAIRRSNVDVPKQQLESGGGNPLADFIAGL